MQGCKQGRGKGFGSGSPSAGWSLRVDGAGWLYIGVNWERRDAEADGMGETAVPSPEAFSSCN